MLSHTPLSECTHACTNVRVCRSGDQMSSHRSYIRLSVALWFCSLVECSEILTEDFHLCISNKSIKHQKEVVCKIKHFYAQIVISYPFCWQHICWKTSIICKKWRCSCTIWHFELASFIPCQNMNLWSYLFLSQLLDFYVCGVYLCEMCCFLLCLCVEWIMKTSLF